MLMRRHATVVAFMFLSLALGGLDAPCPSHGAEEAGHAAVVNVPRRDTASRTDRHLSVRSPLTRTAFRGSTQAENDRITAPGQPDASLLSLHSMLTV
jgi:hypothetical protein